MKIVPFITFSVLLISLIMTSSTIEARKLMLGTIQYPQSLKEELVQPLRIYCDGAIVNCSVDKQNRHVSFEIPHLDRQFIFKLLVVDPENVEYVPFTSKYQAEQSNTIAYRKIKEGKLYKLYSLTLVPEITGQDRHIKYSWRIHMERLTDNERKIPDEAIVVHTKPEWVASLDGSKGFEFPTIRMREDLITLAGSQAALADELDALAMGRTKSDIFYSPKKIAAMKRINNKLIIAAPVT